MIFMWRFYGIWMDCLTSMLILTPVILLLIKIQGRKIGSVHTIGVFLYICVLSGIFSVTGIPNMMHWEFDFSYNIIPMVDLFRSTTQYLLNVLMFIPVGVLLPLLWEQYQGWKGVLKFGCFLTVFIETVQIFTFRTTDIDDILTNLLGALLGYLLVWLLTKGCRLPLPLGRGKEMEEKTGQWVYFLAVLLEQFFIQPYWSMFFWDTLL
jgi:glycopeptide antibiotics resistance protein